MNNRISAILIGLFVAAMSLTVQAQQRRVSRTATQSRRQIIQRLENRSILFRNSLQAWSQSNPNGDEVGSATRDFDDNVRRLHDRFVAGQATALDARQVLTLGSRVDELTNRSNLDANSMSHWTSIRVDLNQLAKSYRLAWPIVSSTTQVISNQGPSRLTGTYRLDTSRSDDAYQIAERETRDLAPSERRRVLDALTQTLQSPDEIAIDVKGRNVVIASTRAAQASFVADGRERLESANGKNIRTHVTLNGDELMLRSAGDAGTNLSLTFDAFDNGQRLNVTRRVSMPALARPVLVQSTYLKTSEVARLDTYDPRAASSNSSTFIVSDGTRVVGVLDDALSTRTAAVGDRFTLRVKEPSEYEGATIEGHISHIERSGKLTGRSVLSLDFDRIRLRDGRTFQFAGLLESVRSRTGETVRVDTEGTVRDQSQTTKTEQRAAIGGAAGAIIGAIAGGGKGAAIGAILGAGGGAGTVYVEGRNDLDLDRGTELTIRAGAPSKAAR